MKLQIPNLKSEKTQRERVIGNLMRRLLIFTKKRFFSKTGNWTQDIVLSQLGLDPKELQSA